MLPRRKRRGFSGYVGPSGLCSRLTAVPPPTGRDAGPRSGTYKIGHTVYTRSWPVQAPGLHSPYLRTCLAKRRGDIMPYAARYEYNVSQRPLRRRMDLRQAPSPAVATTQPRMGHSYVEVGLDQQVAK